MYAIREGAAVIGSTISRDNHGGEWYRGDGRWTPCSDEAEVYESEGEARAALGDCGRLSARVVEID